MNGIRYGEHTYPYSPTAPHTVRDKGFSRDMSLERGSRGQRPLAFPYLLSFLSQFWNLGSGSASKIISRPVRGWTKPMR